jgi:hypothetical protein
MGTLQHVDGTERAGSVLLPTAGGIIDGQAWRNTGPPHHSPLPQRGIVNGPPKPGERRGGGEERPCTGEPA